MMTDAKKIKRLMNLIGMQQKELASEIGFRPPKMSLTLKSTNNFDPVKDKVLLEDIAAALSKKTNITITGVQLKNQPYQKLENWINTSKKIKRVLEEIIRPEAKEKSKFLGLSHEEIESILRPDYKFDTEEGKQYLGIFTKYFNKHSSSTLLQMK